MKITRVVLPAAVVSALLCLSGAAFAANAAGPTNPPPRGAVQRLCGVVQVLQGGSSNPTGLTIQLGLVTWNLKLVPNTVIVARSAEAEVEGLLPDDYVVVNVQTIRKLHVTVVRRLTYDVQPFAPLRTFMGTVLRESPDGKRFLVKIGTDRSAWLRTSPRFTRFELDGKVVDTEPVMTKGELADVLGYHTDSGWLAVDVGLTTTSGHTPS